MFNDTAGLAHSSLLAREEKNRMMICLSDGELNDHEESARSLRQARVNGILTFGIYLGTVHDPEKMDQLYGKGNWTSIQNLGDMPKAVAQRMAAIFKSMR
jgi:nitric oxide reductase activation protein